jgi:acyl CoA:acetate/3-ketoacid CoA transferase alpha subunit
VKVRYCPQSCTAYSTVKTVTLSPTGTLRTTVTASADGYGRLLYPGTAGDEAVKSAADHVDVR